MSLVDEMRCVDGRRRIPVLGDLVLVVGDAVDEARGPVLRSASSDGEVDDSCGRVPRKNASGNGARGQCRQWEDELHVEHGWGPLYTGVISNSLEVGLSTRSIRSRTFIRCASCMHLSSAAAIRGGSIRPHGGAQRHTAEQQVAYLEECCWRVG